MKKAFNESDIIGKLLIIALVIILFPIWLTIQLALDSGKPSRRGRHW